MKYTQENRLNISYYSKEIFNFINKYVKWDKRYRKTYTISLKEKYFSDEFYKGFLRGSLDSDGYCRANKIIFSSVSPGLIKNIAKALEIFNINFSLKKYIEKRKNRKDIYHISINKLHHNKFMNLIKPRNIKGD